MTNREKEIEAVNAYLLMEAPYMADLLKEHRYDDFMKHLKQSETELVDIIDKLVNKVNELSEQSEELRKETPADKMFEELDYHKFFENEKYLEYKNTVDEKELSIIFWKKDRTVSKESNTRCGYITMEELKAINKKYKELGWI